MDDKMFELMEKMYSEVMGIRQDLTSVKGELSSVKEDVKGLNIKVDKNTMLLENLTTKSETIAEVQKSHMEQNENAHKDLMKNLISEKIEVIELAVKDTSKDVKEIKNGLINVEIITSSNWNEIAKLKAIK
jgi:gas vesicle protein